MIIRIFRGDTHTIPLKFTQDGANVNITDWIIFFTIKKNADNTDENADLKKDITTHANPTQGETEILLTSSETEKLCGTYDFDIQYKDESDNIKTVIKGKIAFDKDVTRRTSQ